MHIETNDERTNIGNMLKINNDTRRRVMKMAHVRMKADRIIFGSEKGDFASYLRGAWLTVKTELAKQEEEARIAEMSKTLVVPTAEEARVSFEAGLAEYYGVRGRYYGD